MTARMSLDRAVSLLREMADNVDVDGNWGSDQEQAAAVVLDAIAVPVRWMTGTAAEARRLAADSQTGHPNEARHVSASSSTGLSPEQREGVAKTHCESCGVPLNDEGVCPVGDYYGVC